VNAGSIDGLQLQCAFELCQQAHGKSVGLKKDQCIDFKAPRYAGIIRRLFVEVKSRADHVSVKVRADVRCGVSIEV